MGCRVGKRRDAHQSATNQSYSDASRVVLVLSQTEIPPSGSTQAVRASVSDDFANPDLTTVSPLEAYKRIMARFDAELSWRSRSDYSPRALWYWHGRKAFKQAWIHSAQEISPVCAELGVVMVACGVQEKARAAETSTPVAPTRRGWSAARRWRHEQTKVGV